MAQLEVALEISLHKKVVKFLYNKARQCYYIQINDEGKHRISDRELDIVTKAIEIIKIKMDSPETQSIFERPKIPSKTPKRNNQQ